MSGRSIVLANSTLFWHDYETWGPDPRRDRPAQFAGLRTSESLEEIDRPVVLYCRPTPDFLPDPESCLITRLTPSEVGERGICEAEFASRIHDELSVPGTISVGYNSLRFDDEVTRFTLFRNFFDPYGREWRNGCSRWDVINLVRLTRALRPDGIRWPDHPEGGPSFRLEDLTAANDIPHSGAHDALADVRATIAVVRLIRRRQPRLYDYVFQRRGKDASRAMLDLHRRAPVLHVSSRYTARYCGLALVMPVVEDPRPGKGIVVYDLRFDPEPFLGRSAEELAESLFTPAKDLPEDRPRPPLKTVHLNRAPVLAPVGALDSAAAERLSIDLSAARRHHRTLLDSGDFAGRVRAALELSQGEARPPRDAEDDLYSGFVSAEDRFLSDEIRSAPIKELASFSTRFADLRLREILFRYRARNWPQSLSDEERDRWNEWRRARLQGKDGRISLTDLRSRVDELRQGYPAGESRRILDAIEQYALGLGRELGIEM